ncbi:MAG TPA: hypothetical protein V6C81_07485 [Planktothrix sp.]|jgi:hypothetical protein
MAVQTGFANLMANRKRHLFVVAPNDSQKMRTLEGEKTLKLTAFDGEITLKMPKVSFTPEQTEALLKLAKTIEEAVATVTPAPHESRLLITAKLPAHADRVDIPNNLHVTQAQYTKPLPQPKGWHPLKPFTAEIRKLKPAASRQSLLNLVPKHCRRFNLTLDRASALRACKTALGTFGFDFMQLGDRRVICLKPSSAAKMCLEIVINADSPSSTEICLLDYSRGANCNANAIRAMLMTMQEAIEQEAA